MSDMKPRELVLPPGQYAYVQDATKGNIKVFVGPVVVNQTNQDVPIVFNDNTQQFEQVATLDEARRFSPVAPEGDYLILSNPATKEEHPVEGQQSAANLSIGRSVNVPGPVMFALWPSQTVKVVKGHQLRSNQYLIVRVYNEDEAKKNWSAAVVKSTGDSAAILTAPSDLSVGRQFIIKGTEVSFYIPPTGISVVQGATFSNSYADEGSFVRDALTLEQLDYCILVDEDGTKRYEKGPQVVFPEPTEKFIADNKGPDNKGEIKFRAIELNALQGLHIKVIAPYTEGKNEYKEGEELFITGAQTQIYYPREEHSLISYDGNQKQFAVAVPPGEARYVMNRMTGTIGTFRGPMMLLPNPVFEVIVRRHLTDREVEALYPGNAEALEYNRTLREIAAKSPTTRTGVVSEGDLQRNTSKRDIGGQRSTSKLSGYTAMDVTATALNSGDKFGAAGAAVSALMPKSNVASSHVAKVGDEITRSSTYTQPRSLVFGSKFEGVPTIKLFTGYAIMVVNAAGQRRVVQGPAVVQLDYDETVEILRLSTGKPKNMDIVLATPYLLMQNNKVSDILEVETSDHVRVSLKLSHVVNFTGDPEKWFSVTNYVKFMCDHVRSMLKGAIKQVSIEEFYQNAMSIIQKIVLGESTLKFKENGMEVVDVEVLDVSILDTEVAQMLSRAQRQAVSSNIQLAQAARTLDFTKRQEEINRAIAESTTETRMRNLALEKDVVTAELVLVLAKSASQVESLQAAQKAKLEDEKVKDIGHQADLNRTEITANAQLEINRMQQVMQVDLLREQTEAALKRFAAVQGGLSEALLALSSNETLVKMAQAHSVQTILGGESVVDVLTQIFSGSALEGVMSRLNDRIAAPIAHANGKSTSSAQPKA